MVNTTVAKLGEIANSTSFIQFMQGVNTHLMDGWYGILILIATMAILFIAFVQGNNNPRESFAATLVLGFLISILMRSMNLIPTLALALCFIGAALAVTFAIKT